MKKDFIPDGATYIVLNISSPMAELIRSIRQKFDPERSIMPAEITITGSSGTGRVVPGQSMEKVSAEIDRIAARFAPFSATFDKVERFPDTDIYFLTLSCERPFERIRKEFERSSIEFQPMPYPFRPHCTLKLRSTPSDQELLELLFMEVPREPFTLTTISMYNLPDVKTCDLLYAKELSGSKKP